jgi:hypothetical protein
MNCIATNNVEDLGILFTGGSECLLALSNIVEEVFNL